MVMLRTRAQPAEQPAGPPADADPTRTAGTRRCMEESERLARVFVELADTLIEDFDVVDFLQTLTDRCVELLRADAAGLMLTDQRGGLQLMAATLERARVLEVFELQVEEGPCRECFTT